MDLNNNKNVYFLKVNATINDNQKFYSIFDDIEFQNLPELVDYYRNEELKTIETDVPITLSLGIHKKTVSINEDWYKPEWTSEEVGNLILERYKIDGSFFIRSTDSNEHNEDGQFHAYTLSFYMKNEIFKSKIFIEIDEYEISYVINNTIFQSLKEIVEYYKEIPVHGQQTLTQGIKNLEKTVDKPLNVTILNKITDLNLKTFNSQTSTKSEADVIICKLSSQNYFTNIRIFL